MKQRFVRLVGLSIFLFKYSRLLQLAALQDFVDRHFRSEEGNGFSSITEIPQTQTTTNGGSFERVSHYNSGESTRRDESTWMESETTETPEGWTIFETTKYVTPAQTTRKEEKENVTVLETTPETESATENGSRQSVLTNAPEETTKTEYEDSMKNNCKTPCIFIFVAPLKL